MKLLDLLETSEQVKFSPNLLGRFSGRQCLGLPAIHLGGRGSINGTSMPLLNGVVRS
jgi:hypothetical protein